MAFRVGRRRGPDRSTPPQHLVLPPVPALPAETVTRRLALVEVMSAVFDGPVEAVLGTIHDDPAAGAAMWTTHAWMDDVTEAIDVGATEVWEIYNATADAHPIHVHEVAFEVVDRRAIVVDEMMGTVELDPSAPTRGPEPWETGVKDTVIAYPGEVTRIRATFDTAGQYVWHCHIVEHEDNEMMRPMRVGPVQSGQPAPPGHGHV
jgi:FtsP/CotA-like multicopper oxidase with cupredoxin domain